MKRVMSKKLLQINVTANWGSTGKIAEQIGLLAIERGWESYIAYGRMMNPSKSNLIKIGSQWDVYRHYAEGKLLEGLASKKPTRVFLKVIDEIKPDIVHLHNIHDHYMNYPLLFRYLAENRIPVVWTQHDQWATTGHCTFNLVGCDKWKTGCGNCPEIKWYSLDRSSSNYKLKKKLLEALPSLTIVPVSEWLRGMIVQSHLKDNPIRLIHNGIDLDVFKPQEQSVHKRFGIEGKKIVLGVAAVWDERKGLDDFYELSNKLNAEEYAIVIVGKINGKNDQGLGSQIDGEKHCQMVLVERTQNQLELAQLYTAASVFVNPTYQDNYPTTNLEVMACGTPVITYDTGGSPEAVDEETGRVIKQGDIDGLKKAVEDLSGQDLTDKCLQRAGRLFDGKIAYNAYIKLYNKLIGWGKFSLKDNSLGCRVKVVLGVSSVWSKSKGLLDFIELSKQDDLLVVLVGVSEDIRKTLPPEIVAISRTQNQKELAMLYSLADVFANPTYADMFPTVNLEALACGTPVITYRTGGSPEAVTQETGTVVEQGDIMAMAEAIKSICSKDSAQYAIACHKRAEQFFDKDKCFERYIELYDELLSN